MSGPVLLKKPTPSQINLIQVEKIAFFKVSKIKITTSARVSVALSKHVDDKGRQTNLKVANLFCQLMIICLNMSLSYHTGVKWTP